MWRKYVFLIWPCICITKPYIVQYIAEEYWPGKLLIPKEVPLDGARDILKISSKASLFKSCVARLIKTKLHQSFIAMTFYY